MTTHTYYGDLTAKCAASGLTILQMRVVIYYQWVPRAGFDVRDPVMMCAKPSSPCPAGVDLNAWATARLANVPRTELKGYGV